MAIASLSPLFSWLPAKKTLWAGTLLSSFASQGTVRCKHLCIGFPGEPLRINYYWPTSNCLLLYLVHNTSMRNSPLLRLSLHMRTSCSGIGAVLWDFTKALSLHICVYLYIIPLWRRWFPLGFHQSSLVLYTRPFPFLAFCLEGVCGWFFGLVACFC